VATFLAGAVKFAATEMMFFFDKGRSALHYEEDTNQHEILKYLSHKVILNLIFIEHKKFEQLSKKKNTSKT
jgi:hypothetical protein